MLKDGDVDTNAAIVGGMLGAFHGIDKIPSSWIESVIETHKSVNRVDFLKP